MAKYKFPYLKVRVVRSEERRYSSYEIAEKYNLYTVKVRANKTVIFNKPHYIFALAVINNYIQVNDIKVDKLFDDSKPGRLIEVYPEDVCRKSMEQLLSNVFIPGELSVFTIGKTKYNFILRPIN